MRDMQSVDVIVMSCTNSSLLYGTQGGCNCNPFGNVATVVQISFTVSVISFICKLAVGSEFCQIAKSVICAPDTDVSSVSMISNVKVVVYI